MTDHIPAPLTDLDLAIGSGRVVTRDARDAAVATAVERAERKAAAELHRLRDLLEISAADRVTQVLLTLRQVTHPRGGTHDVDCWQRHARCLANRIYDLLDGETPGPTR